MTSRNNRVFPFVPTVALNNAGQRGKALPYNNQGGETRGALPQSGRSLCTAQDSGGPMVTTRSHWPPGQPSRVAPLHSSYPATMNGHPPTSRLPPTQYCPLPDRAEAMYKNSASSQYHQEGVRPGPGKPHVLPQPAGSSSLLPHPNHVVPPTGSTQSQPHSLTVHQEGCHRCHGCPKHRSLDHHQKNLMLNREAHSYPTNQLLAAPVPQDTFGKVEADKTGALEHATYLQNKERDQSAHKTQQEFPKRRAHCLRALLDGCTSGDRFTCISRPGDATCRHCYVMSSVCWLAVIITILIFIVTKVTIG
ncbi:uncharacterized protein LOC144775200 isoform X2 [Lissotriton helveticus]